MKKFIQYNFKKNTAQSGFILVLAMVVLLMLSLFGAWALQTSTNELQVAGGLEQVERQFNIAEGGANSEAINLGFKKRDFYNISDPTLMNKILPPKTKSTFDPGADNAAITSDGDVSSILNDPDKMKSDPTLWPWRNLCPVQDNNDEWPAAATYEKKLSTNNELDYRYLVTYLMPNTIPPIGYGQNVTAYNFRIQGNAARTTTVVELGGINLGTKMTL